MGVCWAAGSTTAEDEQWASLSTDTYRSYRELLQASGAAAGTPQLEAQAKNTVDGTLNLPDPATGPKPEAVWNQFAAKAEEALPNATVKAVKAVNAVYQNVDLSRLMDRVLALSRTNILGAFPGTNPFGFQADPNMFCLFAVPVTRHLDGAGAPAGAPSAAAADPLSSFVAANQAGAASAAGGAPPASPLDAYLGGGALGALSNLPATAGLNSFAATQRARSVPGVTAAPVLSSHFKSYLQGGFSTPSGGISIKNLSVLNPFDPNAKPINLRFSAERPSFNLPQGGIPGLPQPGTAGAGPGGAAPGGGAPGGVPGGVPGGAGADALAAQGQLPSGASLQGPGGGGSGSPVISAVAFDGLLSDCTVILGSQPHDDGTFDRTNTFTTLVSNGAWSVPSADAARRADQVAYIVPAAKGNTYPPIDPSAGSPGFCYDTGLLLPAFNPLAVELPAGALPSGAVLAATPLSTLLVFGQPIGLTQATLQRALGIDAGIDVTTFNALADSISNPSGAGTAVLKQHVMISNAVTVGATVMNNNSASYASFAILMDQTLARQVLSAGSSNNSATAGRRLLDGSSPDPNPPLNAASAPALAAAFKAANSAAASYPDPGIRAGLWANAGEWLLLAAAAATANVNQAALAAGSAADVEKTSYIAQTKLAEALLALRRGDVTLDQFKGATSPEAVQQWLAATQLPGSLGASQAATAGSAGPPRSTIIAAAVVPTVVVLALVLGLVAFLLHRRGAASRNVDDSGVLPSGGSHSNKFWWRSPLWGRGDSGSTPSGSGFPAPKDRGGRSRA
ncbi:hypothetical protein WJX81_007140 [Elliptochloris bilobata]|uniref:Uncharacterized protein n=1 Tax=Elliptochloris bilobata TaxID=381761 RepID=A0AAW1R464_9CHLO